MRHVLLPSALTPLAVMALCLSGCGGVFQPQIVGSGKAATEKRDVAPFTKIQGGGAFPADVSGASKIDAAGTVESLRADCSGASHVNALDLVAQKVTVKASGASHIEITVKESLVADAHGASSIRFAGAPQNVTAT